MSEPATSPRPRLSLGGLFAATLLGLVILLGVLFWLVLNGSRRSILETSTQMRETASNQIARQVSDYLAQADGSLQSLIAQIDRGVLDPHDHAAMEKAFYSQLLEHEDLDQVTFTYGASIGFDKDGNRLLAPEGRGQISVSREPAGTSADATQPTSATAPASRPVESAPLFSRRVGLINGQYIEEFRRRARGATFDSAAFAATGRRDVKDPTTHFAFTTPASRDFEDQTLPTDLAWSHHDLDLDPLERRVVVVSRLRTIRDRRGEFVGVLDVALLVDRLDRIAQFKFNPGDPNDPHRVFLCDDQGRLISRVIGADRIQPTPDDELRFASPHPPPEVAAALRRPELAQVGAGASPWSGRIDVDGHTYLLTFRALNGTRDWIVGVVVPESYYLGRLVHVRNQLLVASAGVMLCILVGGVLTLRLVRGGFRRITEQTGRMQKFMFAPAPPAAPLEEVHRALSEIESAKTALRAMGKYVPIDLVRQLYERNAEPTLGGELMELTVMFTDIRQFTDLAECLEKNRLAAALGKYFQVMTDAIQGQQGVIDKFMGDAVMALWNAPRPVSEHPAQACAAALACVDATATLFRSPDWNGLPPLVTRFGIHTDRVTVGHFGAPTRMNYTAIGDGVNTASRLESLNKHYGTMILVSDAVFERAKDRFRFRRLDRVNVVGKRQSVDVYELIGAIGATGDAATSDQRAAHLRAYAMALDAYFRRDFATALRGFESCDGDAPAAVLAGRCRAFLHAPPPADWDGTHAWDMK